MTNVVAGGSARNMWRSSRDLPVPAQPVKNTLLPALQSKRACASGFRSQESVPIVSGGALLHVVVYHIAMMSYTTQCLQPRRFLQRGGGWRPRGAHDLVQHVLLL